MKKYLMENFYFLCSVRFIRIQPSRRVLRKRCSGNMLPIYRRITMPKCDFNKVAKQNESFR